MAPLKNDSWIVPVCRLLEKTIIAAFTTRNTIPFLSFLLIVFFGWKLEPTDLAGLLRDFMGSRFIAALGWTLFGITFLGAWRLFVWQEARQKSELERLERVKQLAIKGQMELPLNKDQPQP